ncbi:MAG: peptide MFS transporter [Gemmatimonadota bacterium]
MTNDPTPDAPTGPAATAGGESPTATVAAASGRTFFGHPMGLATLFFTELWERLSYYGMRGILILFMTAPVAAGGLEFDTMKAGAIYGLYTSLVYMTALPGGWVADKLIGSRRAVLWGGIVIAAGHFAMAFPGLATFYLGLLLIAIGTGLLKPNISSMVGDLYPEGGARRDAGFSLFYMGINVGAVLAPWIVGSLGEKVDWHLGFAAAGIGMVAGLIQYVAGGKHLGDAGLLSESAAAPGSRPRAWRTLLLGTGLVVVLTALAALLDAIGVFDITFVAAARLASVVVLVLVAAYFIYTLTAGGLDETERGRIGAIGLFFLFSVIFWAGFEQAGSSLNLVAERLTDLDVFGIEMAASWLQSVNPFFIILLAPVFAWLWVALGSREPSTPIKFALGLILMGLGFGVISLGAARAATGVQISPMWLVVTYFFHTSGELCLSPVGLSAVTKLSPQRMVGQMMGVWFMSIALGNLVAGQVAGFFEVMPLSELFGVVFLIGGGAGMLLALFSKPVRGLMRGIH